MKALIVDDEFYIREGLKKSELWAELNIHLVGEAADGREAWDLFVDRRPDILLLDINMPGMNGIDLAKAIREQDEEAQIIVLTGYDEFQLVQQAVSLQVSDYLLKPVIREELRHALRKAGERVNSRVNRDQYLGRLRQQVTDFGKAAHEQLLIDLLQHRRPLKECLELLASAGIRLAPDSSYGVLCCDIDDFRQIMDHASARDRQSYQYAYRKLAMETLASHDQVYVLGDTPGRINVLAGGLEHESALLDMARQLRATIAQYLKMSVSIGISPMAHGVEQVYQANAEAQRALEYKALAGGGKLIPFRSVETQIAEYRDAEAATTASNRLPGKELFLLSEMRAGNEANVFRILREWSEELHAVPWREVRQAASQLVLFVMRLAREVDLNHEHLNHADPLVDLGDCQTIDELTGFLRDYFAEVGKMIHTTKDIPSYRMIRQAKTWIREHLSDNPGLVDLAGYLNVSPKYLSSRFKQATGETFVEFTTRIRFDWAKELMADASLKIVEIANTVGYADSNYFSMAFKKNVGVTPTEYRKRFL